MGIIHVDRHVDTQDKDMDEIMHTCPWFHATNISNCPPKNLVQLGIGGWQVPRAGVKVGRERHDDPDRQRYREDRDRQDARDRVGSRLEGGERCLPVVRHRRGRRGVRARHGLAGAGRTAAARGAEARRGHREGRDRGHGLVEVSPPYDIADITSLLGARLIVDTIAVMVKNKRIGGRLKI